LRVSNVGSDSIGPLAAAITGSDAAAFQVQTNGCDLIPPGGLCTISIAFTPQPAAIDPAEATLTVKDTGSGGVAAVFPLGGFIGSCNFLVMESTGSLLGTMAVGTTSDPITFTVSWTWDLESGPLTVTVSSPDFLIGNDGCSRNSIAYGRSCTFDVSLRPTSAGRKTATVTVSGDYQQTVSTTISGKGI
jgi:hypothetical protein